MSMSQSVSRAWREAARAEYASEHDRDYIRSTSAVMADAAVRVVLEHLCDQITPIWDGGEQVDDAVSGRHIRKLLKEIDDA